PLAYNVISAGQRSDCPAGATSTPSCNTQLAYDASGRVSSVTQPAPSVGAARPKRTYCYGFAQANANTSTCQTLAAGTSAVGVAGMTPTVGYVHQVKYDSRNRIVSSSDSGGLTTTYTWDDSDRD